ncbi:hypothetical protein BU090_09230 [Staphylococcus warneri]|nr:hypothetical protein BU090_09230 [Staphylococcus warneri]
MITAASGCIVALFAHWLRNRNDKKIDNLAAPKNPLTTSDNEGECIMLNNFVKYFITLVSR